MASAGTGILLALAVVLLRLMDLGGMTEQSSALLGAQISALVSRLTVEAEGHLIHVSKTYRGYANWDFHLFPCSIATHLGSG